MAQRETEQANPAPAPAASRSLASALGLLIALGGPALIIWVRSAGLAASGLLAQRAMSSIAFWAIMAVVLLWVALVEQKPLSSLGFRRLGVKSLAWGFGAGVVILILLSLLGLALSRLAPSSLPEIDQFGTLPLMMRAFLVLTSGLSEELLFIAYPLTRLQAITGSRFVAAAITLVVFVALHIPGRDVTALINVGVAGALLIGFFLWRRDLWSNILAHASVDFVPIRLLPLLVPIIR